MNEYLILKTLHVISSVLLAGTGFGSAFYLFFANRSGSLETQAAVCRMVVKADTWFTTPTVIVQPLTGIWMAHLAGWSLDTPWLLTALVLYVVAGCCWLPVVWLQLRMRDMAETALARREPLPARYWRFARWWEALGYPAFAAMPVIFWLMVAKPQWSF
ncbi:DUF2269 domain-containing protein [Mitsuaria sp. WAJ17]|uniref:DUF2269 family protein n=1 Tax=Mitsuaria sp. WAJ17 TaxID=2761452 RepID=UPI001603567D|nr:DUF2269 domain-containing protein [Mitsuaria sp. WAJ17]MBB2487808.1 DUF2269 domain-containing protein [Mitsuaria sp. WAJ17]